MRGMASLLKIQGR